MSREPDDPEDDPFRGARGALVQAGLLQPLRHQDADALRCWQDLDLCAMVEGVFRTALPAPLSAPERARWLSALGGRYRSPTFTSGYRTPYWLLHGAERVGTLSIGHRREDRGAVPISSLYLLPAHRQKGLACAVLRGLYEGVVSRGGGGVCLETYWVWQDSVRYYARRSFWLHRFRRDLALLWHHQLPAYQVAVQDQEARFLVRRPGGERWEPVLRAQQEGPHLRLRPLADAAAADPALQRPAALTLLLHLALRGWPLRPAGSGEPADALEEQQQDLDQRLRAFEAEARRAGWATCGSG